MTSEISTPQGKLRIVEELVFRTYTARQMEVLLDKVPDLELVATYDFNYDLSSPVSIGPETEDVVFVLRRNLETRSGSLIRSGR